MRYLLLLFIAGCGNTASFHAVSPKHSELKKTYQCTNVNNVDDTFIWEK